MTREYTPPIFEADGFNCPHCDAYAHQHWFEAIAKSDEGTTDLPAITFAFCEKCSNYSVWRKHQMILPQESTAPMPSDDMPDDVKEDYLEARLDSGGLSQGCLRAPEAGCADAHATLRQQGEGPR